MILNYLFKNHSFKGGMQIYEKNSWPVKIILFLSSYLYGTTFFFVCIIMLHPLSKHILLLRVLSR